MKNLFEKRNLLIEEAKSIKTLAIDEGRDLTDEELNTIEAKLDEAEQVKAEIDRAERVSGLDSRLETVSSSQSSSRGTQTRQPGAVVSEVKEVITEDPKVGFRDCAEYLYKVIDAGRGRGIDQRLNHLRPMAAAGADEQLVSNDAYGGFTVPDEFKPELLKINPEDDPLGARTTKITMQSPVVRIPARVDEDHSSSVSGGLRVYRTAETDTSSSSRMKFREVKLEANTLMGHAFITDHLLQDSPMSFVDIVRQGFADEIVSQLIDERLTGTGTGEYLGVRTSAALVSVAKEGSQTADTIQIENIYKMRSRTWGYKDAVWFANHDTMPQLLALNDGTNNIWFPSAREDTPDMLLGRPIFFHEAAETIGDQGDIHCLNMTQYLEGTLLSPQLAQSAHVRFLNNEQTLKIWTRNAGTPWWSAALTPKNSSNTLSPFVTLAARA